MAGVTAAAAAGLLLMGAAGETAVTGSAVGKSDLAGKGVGTVLVLLPMPAAGDADLGCGVAVLLGGFWEVLLAGVFCAGVPASLLLTDCLPAEPFLPEELP